MSQDICFHMLSLRNYSTHNPLWQSLWKRQKSKLWSQRWYVWRNSHKFMLLPGNRKIFLIGGMPCWCFQEKYSWIFSSCRFETFDLFLILVFWSTFFFSLSPLVVAAGGSTCGTAAKRGILSTKPEYPCFYFDACERGLWIRSWGTTVEIRPCPFAVLCLVLPVTMSVVRFLPCLSKQKSLVLLLLYDRSVKATLSDSNLLFCFFCFFKSVRKKEDERSLFASVHY